MRRRAVLALACLSLGAQGRPQLELPQPLASYRSWHGLNDQATAVSLPLSVLCASMSKERAESLRAAAQSAYGLHAERFVRVYANPAALATLADTHAKEFPPGAVIVKEKLLQPTDHQAAGIAFMIKHSPGEFTDSAGWEFKYYPSVRGASYAACIECHRTGNSRDYVFSRLKD